MSKKANKTKLISKAADLNAELCVAAYNDTSLTNQQVIEKLGVESWDVISSKVRSLKSQLTLVRRGGAGGTFQGGETAAPSTPANTAAAPTAGGDAGPTLVQEETAAPATEFAFTLKIKQVAHNISGATQKDAATEMLRLLSEMNMKTISITKAGSRTQLASTADLEHGAVYEVRDQLKAAA